MNTRFAQHALLAVAIISTSRWCAAANMPETFEWAGADVRGQSISIPAADRPTVIAFVRPGQQQSRETIEQLRAVLKSTSPQVVLVVSGESAAEQASRLAIDGAPGSVISDVEYAISGSLGVHVWPELLIVDGRAKCVAQLPGLRQAGPSEIIAYLDLASGRITSEQLQTRLTTQPVVADEEASARRLEVARDLIAHDRINDAERELNLVLEHLPNDGPTRLLAARVLLSLSRIKEATTLLATIPDGSVPSAQRGVVEAKACILSQDWDHASSLLQAAVKLNPDPAEAQYLLGLTLQHQGKFAEAAAAYRAAAEATLPGDMRIVPDAAAKTAAP